jgi:hypothetical protein
MEKRWSSKDSLVNTTGSGNVIESIDNTNIWERLEGYSYADVIKSLGVQDSTGYPLTSGKGLKLDPTQSTDGNGYWIIEGTENSYRTAYKWLLTDKLENKSDIGGSTDYAVRVDNKDWCLISANGEEGLNAVIFNKDWKLYCKETGQIIVLPTRRSGWAISSDLTGDGSFLFNSDGQQFEVYELKDYIDDPTITPIVTHTPAWPQQVESGIKIGEAHSGTRLANWNIVGLSNPDGDLSSCYFFDRDWNLVEEHQRFGTVSPMGFVSGEPIPRLSDFNPSSLFRMANGQNQLDLWDGGESAKPFTIIGGYRIDESDLISEVVLDTSRGGDDMLRIVIQANDTTQSDYPEPNVQRYFWFNFLDDRSVYYDWSVGWVRTYLRHSVNSNSGNLTAIGASPSYFLAFSDSGQVQKGVASSGSNITWTKELSTLGGFIITNAYWWENKWYLLTANGYLLVSTDLGNIQNFKDNQPMDLTYSEAFTPHDVWIHRISSDKERPFETVNKKLYRGVKDYGFTTLSVGHEITCACVGAGGTFVVGGVNGWIAYSSDGINWSEARDTKFKTSTVRGIAYAKGRYVAVGDGGKVCYSTSLSVWQQGSGVFGDMTQILWPSTNLTETTYRFHAVNSIGTIFSSADGASWTSYSDSGSYIVHRIAKGVRSDSYFSVIMTRKSDGWMGEALSHANRTSFYQLRRDLRKAAHGGVTYYKPDGSTDPNQLWDEKSFDVTIMTYNATNANYYTLITASDGFVMKEEVDATVATNWSDTGNFVHWGFTRADYNRGHTDLFGDVHLRISPYSDLFSWNSSTPYTKPAIFGFEPINVVKRENDYFIFAADGTLLQTVSRWSMIEDYQTASLTPPYVYGTDMDSKVHPTVDYWPVCVRGSPTELPHYVMYKRRTVATWEGYRDYSIAQRPIRLYCYYKQNAANEPAVMGAHADGILRDITYNVNIQYGSKNPTYFPAESVRDAEGNITTPAVGGVAANGTWNTVNYEVLCCGQKKDPVTGDITYGVSFGRYGATAWVDFEFPVGVVPYDACWFNGTWVISTADTLYKSQDGAMWEAVSLPGTIIIGCINSSQTQLAISGSPMSYITTDLEEFIEVPVESSDTSFGNAWYWVDDGVSYTHDSKLNFDDVEIEAFSGNGIRAGDYDGSDQVMLVGDGGVAVISSIENVLDPDSWSLVNTNTEQRINAVSWVYYPVGYERWWMAGGDGFLAYSLDGETVQRVEVESAWNIRSWVSLQWSVYGIPHGMTANADLPGVNNMLALVSTDGYMAWANPPDTTTTTDWTWTGGPTDPDSETDPYYHIPFYRSKTYDTGSYAKTGPDPTKPIDFGQVLGCYPTNDYFRIQCTKGVCYTSTFVSDYSLSLLPDGHSNARYSGPGWETNGDPNVNNKIVDGRQYICGNGWVSSLMILPAAQARWLLYGSVGDRYAMQSTAVGLSKGAGDMGLPKQETSEGKVKAISIKSMGLRATTKPEVLTDDLHPRDEPLKLTVDATYEIQHLNETYYFFGGNNIADASLLGRIPFTYELLTLRDHYDDEGEPDPVEVFWGINSNLTTANYGSGSHKNQSGSLLGTYDDWKKVPVVTKDVDGWILTSGDFGWRVEENLPWTALRIDKIADYKHRLNILDNYNFFSENRIDGSLTLQKAFLPYNGEGTLFIPPKAIVYTNIAPVDSYDFWTCKNMDLVEEPTFLGPALKVPVNIATGDREQFVKEVVTLRNSIVQPVLRDDYDSLDLYFTFQSVSAAVVYRSTNVKSDFETYAQRGRPTINTALNGTIYYTTASSTIVPIGIGSIVEGKNTIKPSVVMNNEKRGNLYGTGNNITMGFQPVNFISFGQDIFTIYGNQYFFDGQGIYYMQTETTGGIISQFVCYALGMKFLSNSGSEGYFWSPWDKKIWAFTGSNTLIEKLSMDGVEGDPLVSVFNSHEQILWILFNNRTFGIKSGKDCKITYDYPGTDLLTTSSGIAIVGEGGHKVLSPRIETNSPLKLYTKWIGKDSASIIKFLGWDITLVAPKGAQVKSQVATIDDEETRDKWQTMNIARSYKRQDLSIGINRAGVATQLYLEISGPEVRLEAASLRYEIQGSNKKASQGN